MLSMTMYRPAVRHVPNVLFCTAHSMSPAAEPFLTLPPITAGLATGRMTWNITAYAHM